MGRGFNPQPLDLSSQSGASDLSAMATPDINGYLKGTQSLEWIAFYLIM